MDLYVRFMDPAGFKDGKHVRQGFIDRSDFLADITYAFAMQCKKYTSANGFGSTPVNNPGTCQEKAGR